MNEPKEIKQAAHPDSQPHATSRCSSLNGDDDTSTMTGPTSDVDDESASITSTISRPDPAGRRDFSIPVDQPAKPVYEAWELVCGDDLVTWDTWKTIWGIKFGLKNKSLDDGFVHTNPLTSYDQGELADLHANAIREYEAKKHKKGKSYSQDLANRLFALEDGGYGKLQAIQALVGDRSRAANKTPYRRREWKIIVLEEREYQMTEELPERKKGLFRRRPKGASFERIFLVLRGEEVNVTKQDGGWRLFNRFTNPWWRIDMFETREARREHQDLVRKLVAKQGGMRPPGIALRNIPNFRA
ncbi:hypothetical protein M426DRAFT_98265 [Hypoxylon sp. CI-4A]|nr:hypothetical protein M426DRAFT_98265 [Hypoxylon sp. CI-4A]